MTKTPLLSAPRNSSSRAGSATSHSQSLREPAVLVGIDPALQDRLGRCIRPLELAGREIGLFLRRPGCGCDRREPELYAIAFLVAHGEAGDRALGLDGVADLGQVGPGLGRAIGIEPGIAIELLVVVDHEALDRDRDRIAAGCVGEFLPADKVALHVCYLVVELEQGAEASLGLRAAIHQEQVRAGIGRQRCAEQRIVLVMRLHDIVDGRARMLGLEDLLGLLVVGDAERIARLPVPDGDFLRPGASSANQGAR